MNNDIGKALECMGKALDWDDIITSEGEEFTLLPEGDYKYTITKLERGLHGGSAKLPSCKKAIITVAIDGGELGNTAIKQNLFLYSTWEGRIAQFFVSIGLKKPGEPLKMEWNKVVGKSGICHVFIDKWQDDKGETRESNKIKRFLPPDDSAPTPAPAPTATQSWTGQKW